MAVYVIPRDRNNIWRGGGRGGGILDLLGQALFQPMLQRDALARQYKYDERLANQKHDLDLAVKQADWDRRDYEANRVIEAYNRDPRRAVGGGEMLAFLPGLGYNGNVSDVAQWALPQMITVDQGDQKTVAPVYSGGFIGNGETYDVGLSPQEAGTLALSTRAAELEEWKARQAVALEREKARRGAGPALVPLQGYANDAGNPLLYNQYTGQTVPLYGAKPIQQQPNMAQTALTASEIVKNIFPPGGADGNFGVQTGGEGAAGGDRVSVFREMLNALGGGRAPAPVFPGYGCEFDAPDAFGRALSNMNAGGGGGVIPRLAAAPQQGASAPSFREQLHNRRHGDAPVAVPGTPQASAQKPFISAAAVSQYAKKFGMSEEQAREELTRFNSQ